MATGELFDTSVLAATQAALQNMKGTTDKLRRKQIIIKLADDIRAARQRGCTWQEIAVMIGKTSGCEISESTLRTYSRAKSTKRKAKPTSRATSPNTSAAGTDQHGVNPTTAPTDMTDAVKDQIAARTDTPTPRV